MIDGPAVVRGHEDDRARRYATRWIALAIAALGLSGALAMVLVIGRLPVRTPLLGDPDVARRSLVVHVDLAVGVWFFAFLAGLFCRLPGARPPRLARAGAVLAIAGVVAFVVAIALPGAAPIPSNYVPVLDHPLFVAGLVAFAAGVVLTFADGRLLARGPAAGDLPPETQLGIRAAAAAFLVACVTFVAAYATGAADAPLLVYYERLFWGGGHVLQTSATLVMLAVWLLLAHRLTGRSAIDPRPAALVFGATLLPTLLGPWLATADEPHRGFTTMMELGLFPPVLVVLALVVRAFVDARRSGALAPGALRSPAFVGLATSVAMTLVGFGFGAAISRDTTLIPAHYHISIGAVTVAFMALVVTVVLRDEPSARARWLASAQPVLYGAGQTLFASGLGIAGFWGNAARKVYGAEQHAGAPPERAGLVLAGLGGLLALAGGVLFIVLVARRRSRRHAR